MVSRRLSSAAHPLQARICYKRVPYFSLPRPGAEIAGTKINTPAAGDNGTCVNCAFEIAQIELPPEHTDVFIQHVPACRNAVVSPVIRGRDRFRAIIGIPAASIAWDLINPDCRLPVR